MTVLKGVLKAPTGQLMANAYIVLFSKANTSVMIKGLKGELQTNNAGYYSFECPIGVYEVWTRSYTDDIEYAGQIIIGNNDPDGPINNYLNALDPGDLTPDVVRQVMELAAQAAQSAQDTAAAADYVWWRWDNLKYGTPNTFIYTHWADDPWSGYQPRAFQGLARGYQLIVEKGWSMPTRLKPYLDNWVNFLYTFMKANNGRSPTEFTADAPPTAPDNDFTGHMTGLWLCGCCQLALAGYQNVNLDAIITMLLKELEDNYIVIKSGFIMNGSWSPAVRENSGDGALNNGMFFGFWAGEILKGLGTYLQYCKKTGRVV